MTAHTTQSSPSIEASQPSSLPTPPVLKAETFTWILRPPPFPPPPTSTSTSNLHIEQCIINNDSEILYEMEDFVFNSTSAPSSYRITGDTAIPSFDDDSFYDTNNNNNNYNNNNNNNNDSRINVMQATTIITSPTSSVTDFNTNFNDFVIYDPLSTSPPSNIDLFPPL